MFPDITGYKLQEGLDLLDSLHYSKDKIIIKEYIPPRSCIQTQEKRIIKASIEDGNIILIISNF